MKDSPQPRSGSHLPHWYIKAVWFTLFAIFVAVCAWYVAAQLTDLMITVAICFFLAFAIEPTVNRLADRGWSRVRATLLVYVVALTVIGTFIVLFGRLLIDQTVGLITAIPDLYEQLREYVDASFGKTLPESAELLDSYMPDASVLANSALGIAGEVLVITFGTLTVLLVTFYLVADGPRFRRAVCSAFSPDTQTEILRVWELAIDKTSSYLVSRAILASICGVFTAVFLVIIDVPYGLALGMFTGIVSQFVPTIGTYIAGVVPVVVAFASSPAQGIGTLAFILVYQQIENLTLEPRISAKAMELNTAVSFLAVLAGAAVLGPIGALLALPFVATVKAFAGSYIGRNDVVETGLTQVDDPDESSRASPRSP